MKFDQIYVQPSKPKTMVAKRLEKKTCCEVCTKKNSMCRDFLTLKKQDPNQEVTGLNKIILKDHSIKNGIGPNPNGPRSVSCDRAFLDFLRFLSGSGRETWVRPWVRFLGSIGG